MKEKFPNKCAWEQPKWITKMNGEDFEKKRKRDKGRGNVYLSEDNNRGIFSKASPWINEMDYHCMSNFDL